MLLDTPVAVRRTAMDLLARREHGRAELVRKLRQRGANAELIESELDKLAAEGLLNEGRYLESFIAARARSGHGPVRIREELAQRGLPRGDIDQALSQAEVDWEAQLQELWQRKFAGQLPQDAKAHAKQARFLAYRGFNPSTITRLLRRGVLD